LIQIAIRLIVHESLWNESDFNAND